MAIVLVGRMEGLQNIELIELGTFSETIQGNLIRKCLDSMTY